MNRRRINSLASDIALVEYTHTLIRLIEADSDIALTAADIKNLERGFKETAEESLDEINDIIRMYEDNPQKMHEEFCRLLSKELGIKIIPSSNITTKEQAVEANMAVSISAIEEYLEALKQSNPDVVNTPEYKKAAAYLSMIKAAKNKANFARYFKLIGILLAVLGLGYLSYKLVTYPTIWASLSGFGASLMSGLSALKSKIFSLFSGIRPTEVVDKAYYQKPSTITTDSITTDGLQTQAYFQSTASDADSWGIRHGLGPTGTVIKELSPEEVARIRQRVAVDFGGALR